MASLQVEGHPEYVLRLSELEARYVRTALYARDKNILTSDCNSLAELIIAILKEALP